MAKKKAARKKNDSSTTAPASKRTARIARASAGRPRGPEKRSSAIHASRHEIGENAADAPLIVDLPIAAGRGKNPTAPTFVGFSAEMGEEYWQDQFAFRILSLNGESVRVMISRVDKGSPDLAWGEKLVVQVLVVDAQAG